MRRSAAAIADRRLIELLGRSLLQQEVGVFGRRDRGGEEIFQLEGTAIGRHVFVGGDARHRRFMHLDRVGDGFQTAEYLRDHGMVDMVVHRNELKPTLANLAISSSELSTTVRQSGLHREVLFVPPSMPASRLWSLSTICFPCDSRSS